MCIEKVDKDLYTLILSQCGACGQVGHMRTNKACPLYTGSMGGGNSSPPESEVEPPPMEPGMDEDDLGYVDGTKLILPPKVMKVN